MRTPSTATSANYQEQFNKQLSEKLQKVREAQPNHIPVYAMKYKNASKYFVQDLEQPLALFSKKYKLKSIYEIIAKQSLKFSLDKLKDDKKVKQQGASFKLPNFYLYTISMIKPDENKDQSQKRQEYKSSQRPIGTFVKLDLEMTYEQAFEKYGRENVLTIVYTDATQVSRQWNKAAVTTVQKWLTRIIIFILILVVVPFLMKSEQDKFETAQNLQTKQKSTQRTQRLSNGKIDPEDTLDLQSVLEIDVSQSEPIYLSEGRTFQYDQETI